MCKKFFAAVILTLVSFSTSIANAAPSGGASASPSNPSGGTSASNGGTGLAYQLKNPLAFDTLQDFIVAILNVIIIIATPIVVIFIVLAGFKYVTARGNPGEIQKATTALTYAVIGGVLILGAVAIAEIIKNLVTSFSA